MPESKEPKKTKLASESKEEKSPKRKKSKRRSIPEGNIYINANYNNTIVTFTDPKGEVITWSSAGSSGFKGTKKATPYAAQVAAENAAGKAKIFGFEKAHVFVKGIGAGREQAIRGLMAAGVEILSVSDITPVPHNGCRRRKLRRV